MNEPIPTAVRLQVSIGPALSLPINVAVTQDGTAPLPSDPGVAGKITLAGTDSDGDGVRDDVQRFISTNFASSAKIQSALTQLAKAYLAKIYDAGNGELSSIDATNSLYAIDCLFVTSPSTAGALLVQLEGQIFNTTDRLLAYLAARSSPNTSFYLLPSRQESQTRCMVNPNGLPN